MLTGIETVDGLFGFGELHHRFFEIVEGALDEDAILLVKVQQVVPDGLFGQHFGIADDDNAVAGPRQRHVQPARIVQETDALIFVGSHARHDDEILLSTLESIHTGYFNILQSIPNPKWWNENP